jgi:hypothetical protein
MRKPEFFIVCPTGLSKARPGDAKKHGPIIRGEKAHSSVQPLLRSVISTMRLATFAHARR